MKCVHCAEEFDTKELRDKHMEKCDGPEWKLDRD